MITSIALKISKTNGFTQLFGIFFCVLWKKFRCLPEASPGLTRPVPTRYFYPFPATKSTLFQFLVPDSKTVTIPHKQLDLIPPFIDEDENIPTHQVVWDMFPHQTRQAAEALAHIRSIAKKEVTLVGRETKHDDPC